MSHADGQLFPPSLCPETLTMYVSYLLTGAGPIGSVHTDHVEKFPVAIQTLVYKSVICGAHIYRDAVLLRFLLNGYQGVS